MPQRAPHPGTDLEGIAWSLQENDALTAVSLSEAARYDRALLAAVCDRLVASSRRPAVTVDRTLVHAYDDVIGALRSAIASCPLQRR